MEAISLSLKVCFLADKILLALGEILKEKKINENESKILKEASDFLIRYFWARNLSEL